MLSVTREGQALTAEEIACESAQAEEPVIKIRPGRASARAELREAWAHRELLYFLVWRDLKVRYRQTALGAAWVVLQPLLTTLVFTIFMSRLARVPSTGGVPYPLFAYGGLVAWTFFSNAVQTCSYSLLGNSHVITKVYFPRLIFPAAVVGVRLVDFAVATLVLLALMPFYGVGVGRGLLMLPVLAAELTLLTLGLGVWLSALSAKYRDLGTLLPVAVQLWMFASPIIYPSSLVPERWRAIYSLNPISGIVEGVRASLFGLPFDWHSIAISLAVTAVSSAYFVHKFCRWQESLVDVI